MYDPIEEYERKFNRDIYREEDQYALDRLKHRNADPTTMDYDTHSREYDCTFAPALTNKSRIICDRLGHKPISKRYNQEILIRKKSLEKLKTEINEERREKQRKEEQSLDKLRLARGGSKSKNGKVGRLDKEKSEGLNVSKLDTYSKTMAWQEKKRLKLLELQHEKHIKTMNESIEFENKPKIGSNIKASVESF